MDYFSKNSKLLIFKKYFFKKFNPNDFVCFFYLLGCTSVFLICQILKTSTLIENNMISYNRCLKILKNCVIERDVIKVCRDLKNQENFQSFVYNLFYTWLLLYSLIREIINDFNFPIIYWVVAHISAVIYSLTCNFNSLKFSISTTSHYTLFQKNLLFSLGIIVSLLCIYQIYKKRVKFNIIFRFFLIYFTMFALLFSISNNVVFHFHHALTCGFVSLFFTDFKSKMNLYIHAILTGIVIQGFNFYSLQEIFMFYISDIVPPNLLYLTIVYSVFLLIWVLLLLYKKYICKKKNNDIDNNLDEDIGFRLIPDIELSIK